jgi:hypothetical protein
VAARRTKFLGEEEVKDESDEEDAEKPLTEETELAMATIAAAAAVLNLIVAGSCYGSTSHGLVRFILCSSRVLECLVLWRP